MQTSQSNPQQVIFKIKNADNALSDGFTLIGETKILKDADEQGY